MMKLRIAIVVLSIGALILIVLDLTGKMPWNYNDLNAPATAFLFLALTIFLCIGFDLGRIYWGTHKKDCEDE